MIAAGALVHRVTIQQATRTLNALGEPIEAWAIFADNLPASLEAAPGREQIAAMQINAQRPYRITLRYLAGVTPLMRVKLGARTFEIQHVDNVGERNRALALTVTEVASNMVAA